MTHPPAARSVSSSRSSSEQHPSTPSTASASADGFLSSGQSPGRTPRGDRTAVPTLHLIGPGQVGRAFLAQLGERAVRVIAISDSSATVFDRDGLPLADVLAHKASGGRLADRPHAETIPSELAIRIVAADIVVDATPSAAADTDAAVRRGRAALQCGANLALCSKNALAVAAPEWLAASRRQQLGLNAVLGGTGRQLLRELHELRTDCTGLALVGNVTTTAILAAVEAGASIDEGIAQAQQSGFLEPDPTLDLDGSDAATKLLVVWASLFGESWASVPTLAAVRREDLRTLDAGQLRERARRGATTRLIARGGRRGDDLRVTFEELPAGSPLTAPADRVVYGYELPHGLRVHTGRGVGYDRTAEALWVDVDAALRTAGGEVAR